MVLSLSERIIQAISKRIDSFYKSRLKRNILGFTLVFVGMLLGVILFYGYINSRSLWTRPTGHFSLLTGTAISVAVLAFIMFYRKVYKPIERANDMITDLVAGDTDLELLESAKLLNYPLFDNLDAMNHKLQDLVFREYNAVMLKKQAELNALQSQINPHFLYNTLESIRGLAMECDANEISDMTKALADLFRYSISTKDNIVELQDELKHVENYLMIQQYRFNNKFIIINEIDSDTMMVAVPKLLLQPIVENAVIHGLEQRLGKGTVILQAYKTQTRLVINVKDDGDGIENNDVLSINEALVEGKEYIEFTKRTSQSIGITNVNSRIRMIFGEAFGIRLYSTKGIGTNVEIQLPLML